MQGHYICHDMDAPLRTAGTVEPDQLQRLIRRAEDQVKEVRCYKILSSAS